YFSTGNGSLIIYNKIHKNFTARKIADCRLNSLIRSKVANVIYATSIHGELITYDIAQQNISSSRFNTGESLHSLYEDRKGRIWIEPAKRGCILFNPTTHSFQLFTQKVEDRFNSNGNRFRILEDNNNVVWLNLKGGGFGYYDEDTDAISNQLRTPEGNSVTLPKIVYSIYYDPAGIIWLTTNETKLVKIILQGDDFKQQLLVNPGEMRSDNEVRGIYYDNKNRLWVGAKSGRLYVYQNGKELNDLFVNPPSEGMGLVYSILQDSRGNIWMGTKGNGLFKATPVNKEETKYRLSHFSGTDKSNGLAGSQFYALLEDKQGRIWLGSFGDGLSMVDEKSDSIKFIHTGNAFTNYPKQGFHKIRHMALDNAGNMWIATTNGLVIMNARNQQSKEYKYASFTKVPGDKESLGHNDIQFIYCDSKNRMWLATSGGGLSLASGDPFGALKFKNFTEKEGMPNDYVLSCVEDTQGKLWIATENGLSRFDPETFIFRNYDSYDGLQKASYSEASVCHRLPDGRLIFGTTKGWLSFDPSHINRNRIPANIVFTNVQINNEDAGPGMNETVLQDDINYIRSLTLKHNQNIVSIDYSILDFRAGQKQAFAYRLLGFDSTWLDDRQQHRATYTNLPPGHYVFEVKNVSSDRYSNAPYRRLGITILPPAWKTWWAYTIYIVLAIALIVFVRRIALAMIRLRHKVALEQKLAALKLNFFTNVSHELRTPLTLIINPLEQIAKKEMLSPEGFAHAEVARRNAERMVRFINQLLDLRKIQSDKATLHISRVEIIGFVKKISEYFTDAAAAKRIQLDIDAEQKDLITWIDADKMDVVIYNLLGNALKFTPPGKKIRLSVNPIPAQQSFSIAVHDQGTGVKKEKLEKIFELFHEEEAASATALKGTGIGLALSKEFITLHGGTIVAANNEDGGLTVTVTLKLDTTRDKKRDITFANLPATSFVEEKAIEKQSFAPSSIHTDTSNAPLVLLVEDNDELRDFLRNQLSEFYRIETAVNGQEGFQKAKAVAPDLIISDIMMPVMD
ncbi:MAG TPA: two-component regulator propeller domain-containing protein, partial [Chitinophagaceae bacterium]|nr:two-component regulator propeller domain-containing protein [Chitinophagaceae bacterium]